MVEGRKEKYILDFQDLSQNQQSSLKPLKKWKKINKWQL
jgi:hypothetical protein